MAFSRMGDSGDQKSEGLEDMVIKGTAGQGSILIACPFYEGQHEIMEDCQNPAGSADSHACTVFAESYIAEIL